MGDTPYRGPGSTGPIIIHTQERLVRIPADCIDDEPGAHEVSTTHAYNATPADLERAGWVPRSALDTQVEATLSNIRHAGHLERERDEARQQRDNYRANYGDAIAERDEVRREAAKLDAKLAQAEERGDLADQRAIDAIAERDGVRRQRDAEIASRDALARVLEQVERERVEVRCLYEAAHCERMRITDVLQRVERERDEARAALVKWQGSAEQERARCVAWLRAEAASSDWASCATWGRALSDTADRLERGEHADTPVPAALPRATDVELFAAYQTAYIISCGVENPSEDQRSVTRVMPAERKGIAAVAARVRAEREPTRDETLAAVRAEVLRARAKFPGRAHMLAALTEEVGEVARALLDGEGRERVRAEAIHVACVALRIAEEGDGDFDG